MNTYEVQINRVFGIFEGDAIKHRVSVLLFLTLVAYQSVSFSESTPVVNILGISVLSPLSEESEEGFLERFSSGAFPGTPPRNETKRSRSVEASKLIPLHNSMNRIKNTYKTRDSSSPFSMPNTGKIGVIFRKYDSVIEAVNNKQSTNSKTRVTDGLKGTNANKNKLDLITNDSDTVERAPLTPSLDIHYEPVDFDIDLSDTGINVRYLW